MTSSRITLAAAQAMASAILEARRAKHLGFRMEDTGQTVQTGQTGDGKTGDDGKTGETTDDGKTVDEKLADLTSKFEGLQKDSRKWESRAKENKAKADKLDALEASNATPDQKLAAAEQKAAQAERELARYKVAAETGIPATLIHGDDEDAMRDHAKALAEFRGEAPKAQAPKPDPTQGGTGGKSKTSQRDIGLEEARKRFGSTKS